MENTLNPTDTQQQFADNIRNATGAAEEAVAEGAQMVNEKAEQFQEAVSAVSEAAQTALSNLGEQITAGAKATDRFIREKPYQATAIAIGFGFLVGYLIKRK